MDLTRFLKQNQIKKDNVFYAATRSLVDESGNALSWEIRPLETTDNERIREECTRNVPIPGKPGVYTQRLNLSAYLAKLAAASVVEPNLNSAELQDSYGVMTPEDLIRKMINKPGEYQDFIDFIQEYNGFTNDIDNAVGEAKN